MNFTPEQITKAKAAKSVEELLALAKENGIELSEEEAKKFFAELNKEGELADDELDNVSGGCGDSDPKPKYKAGDLVRFCGHPVEILEVLEYDKYSGYLYKCKTNEIVKDANGVPVHRITELYEDWLTEL